MTGRVQRLVKIADQVLKPCDGYRLVSVRTIAADHLVKIRQLDHQLSPFASVRRKNYLAVFLIPKGVVVMPVRMIVFFVAYRNAVILYHVRPGGDDHKDLALSRIFAARAVWHIER